jgi:heme exporter protein CcmD
MNLTQLFDMGGYGKFVWSAYALTFIVFILNLVLCLSEKKRIHNRLKKYWHQQDKKL